jgi:hypothetical protein
VFLESLLAFEEVVALSALPADRVEAILELFRGKRLVETDTPSHRPSFHTIPDPAVPPSPSSAGDEDDEITLEKPSPRRTGVPSPTGAPPPKQTEPPRSAPPVSAPPVLAPMPMLEAYTVVINENTPESTRASASEWMRKQFMDATPEERAAFLWDTEGHTLPVMHGIPFDARVTAPSAPRRIPPSCS